MNRQTQQVVRVIVWTLVLCTAPTVAMADYAIESYTIEAGGATSSGGGFALAGTIEPAAPNVPAMTGGPFALEGGVQPGLTDASDPQPIVMDTDGEAAAVRGCGSGIEEALPLLMIGLIGLYAVARRRA